MKNNKKLKQMILRVILFALISLIIGFKFYMWNAKNLVGNAMPMPFGMGVSVVLSGSMEPELSVNDLVLVKSQDSDRNGDVVVYQDGSILVIHRIVSIDGDKVITQGDANNAADDPINISAVKGKAMWHIPFVGGAVRFLQSPAGVIILIIAAVVLFELPYLQERKKSDDELQKIKDEIRRLKGE